MRLKFDLLASSAISHDKLDTLNCTLEINSNNASALAGTYLNPGTNNIVIAPIAGWPGKGILRDTWLAR